jgi:integrase
MRRNRRDNGWDAYVRVDGGRLVWKSFPDSTEWPEGSGKCGKRSAREAAESWVARKRVEGEPPAERARVTFKEAAELWYSNGVARSGWRLSTQKDYRSALRVHLYPAFENVRLVKLTDRRLEAWLTEAISNGLPVRTAAKLHMIIGAIFEHARIPCGVTDNPVRRVKPPRQDDRLEIVPYTRSELVALYRAATSEQDRIIFRVCAELGLRRGEIPAAHVSNIDFGRRLFHVRGAVNHGVLTTPKSRKGRKVRIPRDLAVALDAFLKHRGDPPGEALLFPSADGGYLDASALRRRFVAARNGAGIRKLRFHDLRHTALSHWGDQGMNTWEMQRQAGHASIRTTERYTHPFTDDDEPVDPTREQLDELLTQATPAQLERILAAAVAIVAAEPVVT